MSKFWGKFFIQILKDDNGQAMVEYMIILSAVVTSITLLARAMLSAFDKSILYFGGQLEKDLKTGRAKLDVWSN